VSGYRKWFENIVNSTEYLGTDLAHAAWDHQQEEIDQALECIGDLHSDVIKLTEGIEKLKYRNQELRLELFEAKNETKESQHTINGESKDV
jgi:arginyl-tRNA synthetase